MPERRLRYFLACDFARQEAGSKSVFIGAYGGSIVVDGEMPALLPGLALVACISSAAPRETVRYRIVFPGDQVIEDNAELVAARPYDTHTVVAQFIPCAVQGPGEIRAEYTFADGVVEIGSVRVVRREDHERMAWPG